MSKSLETRLLKLEAREEIKEVMANYCHGIDKEDEPLFTDVWEEDAVWELGDPSSAAKNKQEILEKIQMNWKNMFENHHHTLNPVIEIDIGNGTATAVADLKATATNAKGVPLLITATYYDSFSNRTGKWRFTERKLRIHYMTPVLEPWSNKPESRIKG
ncbi:SnoaL-like domain-containing protein [Alteribacillus persepolensis]|uniref:SnoaL-like domain-containing protein n=1 Tax=Alteribacillus persepolensis TaxID=568899 RepID=A0A1G8HRE1_9BACI|nr:nuclear transport factor 2 family protein [Alteribacillus persepolensis]SDI09236.1 SnoaL-like domain-containing protein [Alteribacillus persepolensis]